MNQFFKTFFAALLAFVVGNFVVILFSVLVIAGIAASFSGDETLVKPKSILRLDLSEQISDQPSSDPLSVLSMLQSQKMSTPLALLDVINSIERAATDDNIEGIYIRPSMAMGFGLTTNEAVRNALLKFKESGKFIVSYSEAYSQGSYYLASVADKMYLNPEGDLSWSGMASGTMFFKDMLTRLGVQPEVIRHGSFKAAVEPFILDKMSPENRLQTETMLNAMWGVLVGDIARSRGLDSAKLQQYASDLTVTNAQSAVNVGMIDSLLYNDEVDALLCGKVGVDEADDLEFISLSKYVKAPKTPAKKRSKNKVAVIYAEGTIINGESGSGNLGDVTLSAQMAEARNDENVKAVVLRINSPGGSALASEVMWREVSLLRKEKPVVVSMGTYAASGGYYIAAPADVILAERTTLTGSIGVFGLMFNGQKGLKEKLGITVDIAKTNPSADMGMGIMGAIGVRPLTDSERALMQREVERTYTTFVGHVAEGRNMSVEEVDKIGGGRVWSGVNALEIGLIDGFGGLNDAIVLAADRAGVATDYRVSVVEPESDPFTQLMNMMTQSRINALFAGDAGTMFKAYKEMTDMLVQPGVQARMPFVMQIQ